MVALENGVNKGLQRQVKDDFSEASLRPADGQISAINAQIERIANRKHVSDTYLITTTYCNGEVQNVEAEKLFSSFETQYEDKLVEELVQAKRILESMEIQSQITVLNDENLEELKIETKPNIPGLKPQIIDTLDIRVKEGESIFQKIAEIIYGEQSKSFVVQSLEQLGEIIKFAEKFGMQSTQPAPKLQDLEVQNLEIARLTNGEITAYEQSIPFDASLPNIPQFRSEAQALMTSDGTETLIIPPKPGILNEEQDPGSREMTFKEKFATAKIKASIKRDIEAAKLKNQEPRRSLLELSNYVLAA